MPACVGLIEREREGELHRDDNDDVKTSSAVPLFFPHFFLSIWSCCCCSF